MVSSVHNPALLCVACHCVMLTIYALAMSFWLHSSGQAKASGVFSFLQNGIIWQLFLLQGADCRGQLFVHPGQVHTMHRLFVLLILITLLFLWMEHKHSTVAVDFKATLKRNGQRLKIDHSLPCTALNNVGVKSQFCM